MKKLLGLCLAGALSLLAGCSSGNTPNDTQPDPPTGVTATAGNAQVTLTWTASVGALSYNIYFANASGVSKASPNKISGITATTYTQTGLTNGTPYFYILTASNLNGEGLIASSQVAATPFSPAPAPPTALTATAGNAQVALAWTASTGATSYNLYYSLTTGVTPANGTKISGITTPSYTQTGLANGSTYFYVVTAVSSGGESPASAQASAKPVAPIPAPPAALTAAAGNAQIALSWTASAGATSYNVYYGTAATVSPTTGTRIGAISGTTYTVPTLTNGTQYFFLVTAVNGTGESAASNTATATPTNGVTVSLVPGAEAMATLQVAANTNLTYDFLPNAVSTATTATISPVAQSALPAPMLHPAPSEAALASTVHPQFQLGDTFLGAFSLSLSTPTITSFNVPVGVSGTVGSTIPANSTINLAVLQNGAFVDVSTFVVGTNGAIKQNLPSVALPGLISPATFLVYQPAAGTSTSVSNLGLALIADDGHRMADGSNGLQVIRIYDSKGALLPTPTITFLDYPNAGDLDGQALTPDGSQGIMVDGGNTVRFFSQVQTGTPVASKTTVSISSYGGDGDSVAILPNGDEAVISGDSSSQLVVLSGILAGTPVATTTIPIVNNRDGLVLSADGKVLLARGPDGLSVFSIAAITPKPGTIAGTISHTFTPVTNFTSLGSNYYFEDGRSGMFLSPVDSSRAAVVQSGQTANSTVQLITSLTSATPVAGPTLQLPSNVLPFSVAISPDGKMAVVGTSQGLMLYSGVDTGTLTAVGSLYAPTYTLGTKSVTLGSIPTLGITLDGKYVLAGDQSNSSLVVVPFNNAGFAAAPASVLGSVAIPDNDQLLVH